MMPFCYPHHFGHAKSTTVGFSRKEGVKQLAQSLSVHPATSVCNLQKDELTWFRLHFKTVMAQIRLIAIQDSCRKSNGAFLIPNRLKGVIQNARNQTLYLIDVSFNGWKCISDFQFEIDMFGNA